MPAIQVVAATFAAAMMYQTYHQLKRRDMTPREVAFWELLWLGLLLVSLFPQPLQRLVGFAHVARLLDLVMIVGMLVISLITFSLYVSTRRLTRALEELVRSDALAQLPRAAEAAASPPAQG